MTPSGETWRKVPGWRLEVSDAGRVRNLSGRVLELTIYRGRYRVRYRGADHDPQARRFFTVSSLVQHAFTGLPLNTEAVPIDGDLLNSRLDNLRPGKRLHDPAIGPLYHTTPDPEATAECRAVLEGAGLPPAVIEHGLTGRDFVLGWADPDACISALVAADMPTAKIAKGMGLLVRQVTARREMLGIGARPRIRGERLPGEVWRHVPGYRAQVSNLGRVRGPTGLMAGSMSHGRLRVKLSSKVGDDGRACSVDSIVLHVFRKAPLSVVAYHRNGDDRDCRLANLEVGEREIKRSWKRDTPWTKQQDRALKKVRSWAEGAAATGHSIAYVKKRMRRLGIVLDATAGSRRGLPPSLVDRDLGAAQRAADALQAAGVGDRQINLGLRILKHRPGEYQDKFDAVRACISALYGLKWQRAEIASALGIYPTTISEITRELGLTGGPRRPKGWTTKLGPADDRDGEEWRPIDGHPGFSISSHGRVVNEHGHLMSVSYSPMGRAQIPIRSADGHRRNTYLVARLVLAAFKPELSARAARPLNGNPLDARVDNLVPAGRMKEVTREAPSATRYRGNLANARLSPTAGSVPYLEPIWAEARSLCPPWYDESRRNDIISDTVTLYLDGRADTVADAFDVARRAYERMFGAWSEASIDERRGGDGMSLSDRINEAGEVVRSGRKTALRYD